MDNKLVIKLRNGAELGPEEEKLLIDLTGRYKNFEARKDISADGTRPSSLVVILEGWATRYKILPNGKRHIIDLFLPGDLCEPFGILPRFMDHSLASLTGIKAAFITPDTLKRAAADHPRIEEALWWDLLVSISLQQNRGVSLARRMAAERLGYFLCETRERLSMIGLDVDAFEIPLTQSEMGDLLGLSSVHINRSMTELRDAGLVATKGRLIKIMDLLALHEFSLFEHNALRRLRPISNRSPMAIGLG